MRKISAIIFEGGHPRTEIDRTLAKLRRAMILDNIEKFKQAEEIDKIIIATNYPDFRDLLLQDPRLIVSFDDSKDFNLGRRMSEIIAEEELEGVFYIGGAAGPLLTVEEINAFARQVKETPAIVMTNNVQSSDMLVFAPADAINRVHVLPEKDNPLGNLLRNTGLEKVLMPHSTGIHFDIDTPTDMLILSLHPHLGPKTKEFLAELPYDISHIVRAKHYMALPYADIMLSGRVGSPVMTRINSMIRCRLRVYSEERGMKYLKREEKELVKSLFARHMELEGMENFFAYIAELVHVLFMDTRIIFAHHKLHLSDNDRFYSDLLMEERVENEFARELIRAIKAAPLTIVPGGHSIVSGGIWVLIDAVLHEAQQEYAEHKLYSLVIPEEFHGRDVKALRQSLPQNVELYAVTRIREDVAPNYTFINPAEDLVLHPNWRAHLAGPIDEIKKLEARGFTRVWRE